MIVRLIDERRCNAFYRKANRRRCCSVVDYASVHVGVWLELAAVEQCLVVKILILDNGNGDATTGNHYSCVPVCVVLWCLRFRLKAAMMLFAILAAAILIGRDQVMGKRKGAGATTFVVWLEKRTMSLLMGSTL